MKRFVFTVSKDPRAVLTVALLVAMLIIETGQALILLFGIAIMIFSARVYGKPPRWLLRSPLGRWLRRWRSGKSGSP